MKTTITFEIDENSEALALVGAVKNQMLIDTLYDEIMRKRIKYGTDDKAIEIAEEIWKEIYEHFNE